MEVFNTIKETKAKITKITELSEKHIFSYLTYIDNLLYVQHLIYLF